VNWFLYDFEIKSQLFQDPEFVKTFKNGLVYNIALKYDLEPTQITVSSVEQGGLTSFQIMPFYIENADDFQKKMDQIDSDLNSHEFRTVLPSVVSKINRNPSRPIESKWNRYAQKHPRIVLYLAAVLIGIIALIFAGILLLVFRRHAKYPGRSESKSPIFDSSYQQAPTEDDHYHAVRAPDGTAYVVVESEDMNAPNDKRVLV
jgi:ATP-dependent Zn protease